MAAKGHVRAAGPKTGLILREPEAPKARRQFRGVALGLGQILKKADQQSDCDALALHRHERVGQGNGLEGTSQAAWRVARNDESEGRAAS